MILLIGQFIVVRMRRPRDHLRLVLFVAAQHDEEEKDENDQRRTEDGEREQHQSERGEQREGGWRDADKPEERQDGENREWCDDPEREHRKADESRDRERPGQDQEERHDRKMQRVAYPPSSRRRRLRRHQFGVLFGESDKVVAHAARIVSGVRMDSA